MTNSLHYIILYLSSRYDVLKPDVLLSISEVVVNPGSQTGAYQHPGYFYLEQTGPDCIKGTGKFQNCPGVIGLCVGGTGQHPPHRHLPGRRTVRDPEHVVPGT